LEGSATTAKASPDRGGLIPENNNLIRDADDPDEHWLGAVICLVRVGQHHAGG
jgi:hypothetical protein